MAPHPAAFPSPELPETPSTSLQSLLAEGVVWRGVQPSDTPLWEQRSSTAREAIPFGAPEIDGCLPHGGLACGAVHELSMHDPLGAVTHPHALPALLARSAIASHSTSSADGWGCAGRESFPFFVVWVGRRSWPTPFSLAPEHLSSCLFLDPPTEKLALWTIETALRSPAVKLVIADTPRVSLATTRRLSLSARAHGTTAVLLRRHSEQPAPSAAMTSWSLASVPSASEAPTWELSLKRFKGGSAAGTTWTITVEDDYGSGADLSLRVLPRMVGAGDQAQAFAQDFQTQRFGT